jgi:hypothetical protein
MLHPARWMECYARRWEQPNPPNPNDGRGAAPDPCRRRRDSFPTALADGGHFFCYYYYLLLGVVSVCRQGIYVTGRRRKRLSEAWVWALGLDLGRPGQAIHLETLRNGAIHTEPH